jgi:hypothetical protein
MMGTGYNCDIWCRAKRDYEDACAVLTDTYIRDFIQKEGAKSSLDEIHKLRLAEEKAERELNKAKSAVSQSEETLAILGFELANDGTVGLSDNAPDGLKESLRRSLDKALGSKEEALAKPFEAARLKLMTVETAEEAVKIIEPFLNFEATVH